jgi:hypothetical protein
MNQVTIALLVTAGIFLVVATLDLLLGYRKPHGKHKTVKKMSMAGWLALKAAAFWCSLKEFNVGEQVFGINKRIYFISALAHLFVLVLLGGWIISPHARDKDSFVVPDRVAVQAPPDDAVELPGAAAGDSVTDGGNDSQMPSDHLAYAALIPDFQFHVRLPGNNPALPGSRGNKLFQIGVNGSGRGNSSGQGKGVGISGLVLDEMEIPLDTVVVLDISGSMDSYLKAIRVQIDRQFSGTPVFNAENSLGYTTKKNDNKSIRFGRSTDKSINLIAELIYAWNLAGYSLAPNFAIHSMEMGDDRTASNSEISALKSDSAFTKVFNRDNFAQYASQQTFEGGYLV